MTITETKTRTITAKYENALYVYFYNPAGTQIMRTEKVGDHYLHGYTDVSYDVDSTHKLVGWAAEANGTTNIADKIKVPEGSTSVNVYAIIKEGYWISFDSDGGSIVDSQFVLNGDKLTLNKSTNPTKPGYTFDGWYNGSAKVENGATVTNPMTLKAHWNAAKVNYTINYWQQKVTDDKNATDAQKTYEYVEAETKKATTGTPISAENLKTYKGFKYNANNSSKDVEIAGDGTTIINVYYDRVLCTVNFYVNKGGRYWSDWQITKTVEGLYGANLPEGAWDTSTYAWYQYKDRGDVSGPCVILTSFDFKTAGYADNTGNKSFDGIVTTCNFYGNEEKGRYKINYYNEQIDGSFKLVQTVSSSYSGLVIHEKYAGYELYKYSIDKNASTDASYWTRQKDAREGKEVDGTPVNVASKLKTYSLSYYNYNSVTKTEKNIKYTASLKSYANYTPAKPSELPSYYVFGGWYKDKACTTKFDFNTEKMPNANVQIYAKWTAKKINLTYKLNTPDGTSKKVNSDVDAGTIASTVLPSATTISDYSFAGWYYADGNGNITKNAFNANEAITKDTSVIGKWLYNGELTVVYNPGEEGSNAKVPTDSNIYAGGAKVTVAKNATTTSKKKFLGWELKRNLYYPGDAFEVNKDLANNDNVITLTAVWGSEEHSTTMSYNPGNGRGSVQTVPVKNNESVTLKSEKDWGYQAPKAVGKEYYFAGWATSKDDADNGKATYAAGQSVHVDVDGENVLYATWIEKTVITVKAKSGTATYTGKEHKVEGFEATEFTVDGNKYTVEGLTASGATGTDAGTYTSKVTGKAVVKDAADNNVTKQFTVNTENGSLVISKATVTLKSADLNKEYDGKALVNGKTALAKEEGWAEGEGATYAFTGSQTVVGSSANAFSYTLKDGTKAGNYTITKTEGTLKVTPVTDQVTVTIKGNTGSEKYDGNSHKVTGYTSTFSNDLYTEANFKFSGKAEASRTDAGQTDMGLAVEQFTNTSANFTNVEFVVTDGYSKVEKRNVTLTSANDEKVYDGNALTNNKVTASVDGFAKDEGATYNVTGSQTKKGTSKNTFTYELKSNTKASNYTIEVVYGDLTVTAEDGEVVVVITGHKKSFEYDGNEKSVKGYDVSITKGSTYEVSDFTFNGNDEVKGTEANTYPMGLKVSDFTNNNDNYNKVKFVVTDGSLTITPKSITPDGPNTPEEKKTGITATDPVDSIYDGKAHVNPLTVKDTKTNKDLKENKDYTLTYSDDVVNVGTVTVTVKGIGNYTGEFTKKYQITPREYTVTTESANKTYDGTALTAGGHVNGLVEGETVSFKTTGSQTNEGTSDNTYELKFKGTAVETNYKHGKDSIGKLTVKKQSIDPGTDPEKPNPNYLGIEISNPSDEVYDGKEHKWSPTVVDKTGKELIVGTDYAVEYATSDFTNTGTINVTITGIGNYTGKVTRTYSITPREYTITTLDGTKVYDGKALTNFGLVDGIVYGETYSFKTTGSQTEVGTSDNTYEWKWNGTAKKSNYKLAKESIGKLTVKAKSIVPDGPDTPDEKKTGITVSEPSDSKYDGKEHKEVLTVTDTKTGKELVAGTDYSVTYSSDLVNAGTVKVTVAGLGNYSGSFTKTYKITKRSVTLTSATVSKVYDGSALTNTSITVSGDGFVEGEGASYEVTGTQTEVGNSANAFEYKLNEKTLASNYNITKVVGTLTITAAPAPVTPATPSTPSTTSTTPRTPSAPQVTTPAETVEKETTPKAEPKKEEKVEEEYTPKASPQYYCALINLICAILTVLFGLLLLISKRHKSEDDDEEDDDETKQQTNNDDEEKEQEKKRGLFTRVLAVLIAIVSVVFFLVTEDLSLPWTWTDQWTIWMVVIGLVQIVVFFVGRKWKNVDNDDEDEEAQQA